MRKNPATTQLLTAVPELQLINLSLVTSASAQTTYERAGQTSLNWYRSLVGAKGEQLGRARMKWPHCSSCHHPSVCPAIADGASLRSGLPTLHEAPGTLPAPTAGWVLLAALRTSGHCCFPTNSKQMEARKPEPWLLDYRCGGENLKISVSVEDASTLPAKWSPPDKPALDNQHPSGTTSFLLELHSSGTLQGPVCSPAAWT
ncbi:uncharacterized protein O9250_006353 isoform 1-T2 [Rhynochetos jubatus]